MKLKLDTDRMIAEVKDGIGWVIYNNPKRLNAVSLEMTEALPVIFDTYEERDDVRVVVLRGAGDRAFVSGADISEFEKNRSSEESRRIFDEKGKIAAARIEAFTKPIIAMVRGYCIGGGLMAALKADIRIASDDAQFGIPRPGSASATASRGSPPSWTWWDRPPRTRSCSPRGASARTRPSGWGS